MRPKFRLAALVLGMGLLGSRSVRADDAVPGQLDAQMEQAKPHFEKANDLYSRQLFTEAAIEFAAAYDAKPLPAFLFNEAVAYEKAKNLTKAIEVFRAYLHENPNAPDKKKLEKRIDALEKTMHPDTTPETPGGPKPEPKPVLAPIERRGVVSVDTKPPGAKIYLDNKRIGALGTAPWSDSIEGEHVLIIEAKGFKPERKEIKPAVNKILEIYVALSKEDYLGWIEVTSNIPHADVFFDDEAKGSVGRTPYSGFLKPGKHTMFVEREGYDTIKNEVTIEAGKAHEQTVTMTPIKNGFVEVKSSSDAGAGLYIDGKKACIIPCRAPVDAGSRHITVERGGKKTYSTHIKVEAASETEFKVALAPKPSRIDAYVTLFVSAAFLGGGIYFGLKSNDIYKSIQKDTKLTGGSPIDSGDPRFSDGKNKAYIADGMYALSGITFLLGTYYLLRDKGPSSQGASTSRSLISRARFAPVFGNVDGTPGMGLGMTGEVRW